MIMNKEQYRNKRSQYEKYVVMAHSQTHQLGLNYMSYLMFKELAEVIDKIANTASDSNQYLHGNEMYEKKITQSEALSNTLANKSPIMRKNPVKTEFIAAWRTFLYPN